MNHAWSCCECRVRHWCRTSCHTPNRKMACQFFPTPALGWTLASFVNTGIAHLSGTTGIVSLSGITVFITWNSRLLVRVLFVQGQSRATGIPLATYSALVGKDQFRPGSAFLPARNTTILSVLHFTVCVLCRLMTLNSR